MQKRSPAFTISGSAEPELVNPIPSGISALQLIPGQLQLRPTELPSVAISDIETHGRNWLYDCQYRLRSAQTIEFRRHEIEKLIWFLRQRGCARCGPSELRQFLIQVAHGHLEPGGRWGNPKLIKEIRPRTVHRYYRELRTFFGWLVSEGMLADSPMNRIRPPEVGNDQVQPCTKAQVKALLEAAKRSTLPGHDTAMLYLLLGTGLRASELCGLHMKDVDLFECYCTVTGKGNRKRTVSFGRQTAKALSHYLREHQHRSPDEPVFMAERSHGAGNALTRDGLRHLMTRLGHTAGIQRSRCSPHTCRHTFAVTFLRRGGNVFTLKEMLGHSLLKMTNTYVALAQADIAEQQRRFSPMDGLGI